MSELLGTGPWGIRARETQAADQPVCGTGGHQPTSALETPFGHDGNVLEQLRSWFSQTPECPRCGGSLRTVRVQVTPGLVWQGPCFACPSCEDTVRTDGHEELRGEVRGLLIRLEDRLPADDVPLIEGSIDADEPGLALARIAHVLGQHREPISADERARLLALADRMELDQRVRGPLALCPER